MHVLDISLANPVVKKTLHIAKQQQRLNGSERAGGASLSNQEELLR